MLPRWLRVVKYLGEVVTDDNGQPRGLYLRLPAVEVSLLFLAALALLAVLAVPILYTLLPQPGRLS